MLDYFCSINTQFKATFFVWQVGKKIQNDLKNIFANNSFFYHLHYFEMVAKKQKTNKRNENVSSDSRIRTYANILCSNRLGYISVSLKFRYFRK
jgi:hypothetical protein